MGSTSTKNYISILGMLAVNEEIKVAQDAVSSLMDYVKPIYRSELDDQYSKPMLWIGLYIALASLGCVFLMVADLVHGLRSRKLWFPCKYFSVNAVSLTVISVAMKLPVDLSGSMPGDVDQVAKLGSMAFMCTMMANLLPCLATMDSNELLTNITALGVMVITLVVNVCIQIETGVISYKEDALLLNTVAMQYDLESLGVNKNRNTIIAIIYVTLLLVLLIIYACSSLAILKSKEIIESKYQRGHEQASKDVKKSTANELKKHVSNYFLMARSGSPQFIIACSETTTASGVICTFTTFLHTLTMLWSISAMLNENYDSDYKWSILAILLVQFIGVLLGTIAPLSRCFATLSFKVSIESISNHMKVFNIESYWTKKLYDWKHGTIRFPFRSRSLKVVIITLKNQILNFCIEIQEGVVVVCKIVSLIPFFFVICVFYCLRCLKWLLHTVFSSWGNRSTTEILEQSPYVLQLEDEKLAKRTLEGLTKSMNRLIQKGEDKQPKNLLNLIKLKKSIGFQGVKMFDNGLYVPSLLSKVEYQDCWSLLVVTLTTIAITLNKIEESDEFKDLLKSVREGLDYIILVEESLNASDNYVCFQKAAETLWQEVDVYHEWLGDKLQDIASQVNRAACKEDKRQQIVQLFLKEAKTKIHEGVGSTDGGGQNGHSNCTSIGAYSMYRITKTILDDRESPKDLFIQLSATIADIMAACLINIPQVIAMKCHTSVIEKREACVEDAAKLLGETQQIINTLQDCDVPSMDPNDLPFINKWRAYLSDPQVLKSHIPSSSNEVNVTLDEIEIE